MRRWLSVLGGVATVALTGMALAWAGSAPAPDNEATTEITVETKATTTTLGETFSPELVTAKHIDYVEEAKEEPEPEADRTPPVLKILHPGKGQVFEQAEVVFEGVTEPGAAVTVGGQRVEVSKAGAWRVVLHLDQGENLVTFKAKDSAGNRRSASIVVFFEVPKEPEPEKPKAEEPKNEKPKAEEPKNEKPKAEEPKNEKPKDHEGQWEFVAHQVYGECAETLPYDVFHGKSKPGSLIKVVSEYGSGAAEVGEQGDWELKVIFESAPVGEAFPVKVKDQFGNHQVFEFVRLG